MDKRYLYTEAGNSFKVYRLEVVNQPSNFRDISGRYFNIGPIFIDPIFDPFQNLPRLHRELVASGWVTEELEHPNYRELWRALSAR